MHRPIVVTITNGDRESMIRLSEEEARGFLLDPIEIAVDDSPPSWELQEKDPERFNSLCYWLQGARETITDYDKHKEG